MTNKYLSYDAERAPHVRALFTRIAGRYDLVNDVMSFGLHRRWKRQTVKLALKGAARPRVPGARGTTKSPAVLDLCCGSGDLAFLAEDRGAGTIVGADFTLPMLAVARRRRREGNHRSTFLQADALRLPFPDGAFDVLTIGYGLRNIADIPAALAEMRRVLAPGGRAVVLDFGKPSNPLAGLLYRVFLHMMMPAVGWLFHGDPETYLYIPASLERFPAQRGVERLMREAGFVGVGYEERLLGTMGINFGEAGSSRP